MRRVEPHQPFSVFFCRICNVQLCRNNKAETRDVRQRCYEKKKSVSVRVFMCVRETRVWIRAVKNGKIWDIHVTSLSQVGTATAEKDLICMRAGHCANTCHRKLYLNSSHAAAPLSTLHSPPPPPLIFSLHARQQQHTLFELLDNYRHRGPY